MDPLTALSAQFDPLRPLEADETDLDVDWQDQLDTADDVKVRLANSIALSPGPVTRLFTGHRGAGKTTELNRVRQRLRDGIGGRKVPLHRRARRRANSAAHHLSLPIITSSPSFQGRSDVLFTG